MKTKIKVADLDKLNFPFQRKEMIRLIGEMRNPTVPGGDSPETAIPFYIKMNHQFACKLYHRSPSHKPYSYKNDLSHGFFYSTFS